MRWKKKIRQKLSRISNIFSESLLNSATFSLKTQKLSQFSKNDEKY